MQNKPAKATATAKSRGIAEAVALVPDGARIMIDGHFCRGTPEPLINELVRQRKSNLTIISNDAGRPHGGIGKLVDAGLVQRLITSHIGSNPEAQRQVRSGALALELVPQGILIERIRAGGAGLGGILTPVAVGTPVESGKQKLKVDDREFVLETPLRADFGLIHAFLADAAGNLSGALTTRTFSSIIAIACSTVIAAADHVVLIGTIPANQIVIPAALVDCLVS